MDPFGKASAIVRGGQLGVNVVLPGGDIRVFLFGEDSWALLDVIMMKVDRTHLGFLLHIIGKQAVRQSDGSWKTPTAKEVLRAVGV